MRWWLSRTGTARMSQLTAVPTTRTAERQGKLRLLKEYQLTEHKRVLRLLSVVPMGLREVATRNTKIYGKMARLSIPACSTRLSSSTC